VTEKAAGKTAGARPRSVDKTGATAEFERIYRANVDAVTAYFARRTADAQLIAGLAALPMADREVIELVDIAGLRPGEAAAALGLTPGTVRMRLMRARGPALAATRVTAAPKRGERIALVPVKAGCGSVTALPLVSRDGGYKLGLHARVSKPAGGPVALLGALGGPTTLSGKDVPKGDVDLVLVQETSKGMRVWSHVLPWLPLPAKGKPDLLYVSPTTLTKAPAPSCVSVPE
jgi:predicted DNA-binding protein (UPF0251 family)